MTVQKDDIYEFGFGRSDQVTKNDNLVDEAVFSFLYGGLFRVLKSLSLTSLLDLEIVIAKSCFGIELDNVSYEFLVNTNLIVLLSV